MAIIRSLVKLAILLAVIGGVLLLTHNEDSYTPSTRLKELKTLWKHIDDSDTLNYFVGSSRVSASINDKLLDSLSSSKQRFHNLGVNHFSFIENTVLADYLLGTPGYKRIFVELSPIRTKAHTSLLPLCQQLDVNPVNSVATIMAFSGFQIIPVVEDIVVHQASSILLRRNTLKSYIGLEAQESIKDWFGYRSWNSPVTIPRDPLFLRLEDFEATAHIPSKIDMYLKVIGKLTIKAKKHNAQLIFFLPMTFRREEERAITIPIFNKLAKPNRLEYSASFVEQIGKTALLSDSFHYHGQGATLYSELFSQELKNKGF